MDDDQKKRDTESIQKVVAATVATHPAGRKLLLIGGFRYRLLDESVRVSNDVDYHWSGDLAEKQVELAALFNRVLVREVERRLGYAGRVDIKRGPDAESPIVRVVDLLFWKKDVPNSRIELPVEVTRILCADPAEVQTMDGIVYATASDGDIVESKVIAVLNSMYLRHRDLVDIFLFRNTFLPDSDRRLSAKIHELKITPASIVKRMDDLAAREGYHVEAINDVIDAQCDAASAVQLKEAGGGKAVLDAVTSTLRRHLPDGIGGAE
jgi:hypothetical protein